MPSISSSPYNHYQQPSTSMPSTPPFFPPPPYLPPSCLVHSYWSTPGIPTPLLMGRDETPPPASSIITTDDYAPTLPPTTAPLAPSLRPGLVGPANTTTLSYALMQTAPGLTRSTSTTVPPYVSEQIPPGTSGSLPPDQAPTSSNLPLPSGNSDE
eukprot:gb/GEZN01005662.1/.p2 GENE.gb/GEZN01005662.1/~~gb/GEZN01005662.1/.p2  ORF type:complete len:155 (+),score=21.98 gb/GEZN01005662.1/:714-1178(+)